VRFEWDSSKDGANQEKHGVAFHEAREVFDDPLHLSILDQRFTYFEERWITVGQTRERHVLVVAHPFFDHEDEEVIRIISASEATAREKRQYENYD
jgi:uncharacterized DUF497 family protein